MVRMIIEAIQYKRQLRAYANELDAWNRKARMYKAWGVKF